MKEAPVPLDLGQAVQLSEVGRYMRLQEWMISMDERMAEMQADIDKINRPRFFAEVTATRERKD